MTTTFIIELCLTIALIGIVLAVCVIGLINKWANILPIDEPKPDKQLRHSRNEELDNSITKPVSHITKTNVKSKNDQHNFHKAALKAYIKGHLRFIWHGHYYATGRKPIQINGK